MKIVRVYISDEKKKISKKILNKLPSWFGIPEGTNEYIEESSSMPFCKLKQLMNLEKIKRMKKQENFIRQLDSGL